jgi:hypothetical protein
MALPIRKRCWLADGRGRYVLTAEFEKGKAGLGKCLRQNLTQGGSIQDRRSLRAMAVPLDQRVFGNRAKWNPFRRAGSRFGRWPRLRLAVGHDSKNTSIRWWDRGGRDVSMEHQKLGICPMQRTRQPRRAWREGDRVSSTRQRPKSTFPKTR